MRNVIRIKGIVIGIIFLFFGISVLPSIGGNSSITNKNINEDRNNNSILDSNEETEYYAIIVACSEYKNESHSIPPPPFPPIREGLFKQLYDSLLKTDNWDESHIILLLNDDATKNNIIKASGIDMIEGTPILDIKPYTPRDQKEDIQIGWLTGKITLQEKIR